MPKEVVLIAAVTVDGFIARHSLEVTSWSKDLQVFKKQTMGFPVIMGSNTDKTLSSNLRGRKKIVVGRKDNQSRENEVPNPGILPRYKQTRTVKSDSQRSST